MPRKQTRKRGHSRTEVDNPPSVENSGTKEDDALTTVSKARLAPRPVKRVRNSSLPQGPEVVEDAVDSQDQPIQNIPNPDRPYNTRYPGRRPAKHLGLNWQQQEREEQEATIVKAQKKKAKDLQKELKNRNAELKAQGIKHIADLEAARELEEEDDGAYLEASTARGYRLAAKATGSAQNNEAGSAENSGSEYHDDDGREDQLSVEDSGEDDEQQQAQVKPKTAAQRRMNKRVQIRKEIDSGRPDKSAQLILAADIHSPTVTQSGSAFNNTYRKTLLDRATASTDQARAATPRQQQTEQLLGRIRPDNGPQNDSRSEHVSQDGEPQTRQRTPVRPHSSMTPALNLDALRIHGRGASTPTPSGGSRTVALSSSSRLSSGRDDDDTHMNNWDFMEGLREDEEGVGIGAVSLGKQRGRPDKTLALFNVQPDPPSKPKGPKRRTRDEMPVSKSLRADALPAAIYEIYEGKFIPTCIDIFGTFKDPWTIKPVVPKNSNIAKPPSLLDIVTLLINRFHEDGGELVFEESDLVYRVTRQRLINWRNGFLGRACTVVREGEKAFVNRVKVATGKKATSAEVKAWAQAALRSNGGEAWYQVPVSDDNDKPRGLFLSVYMLRTFAPHLSVISKSYMEDPKPALGALAMAAAAVEVAFKCFTGNGSYQAPEGDFDKVGGGSLSDKWMRGGVTNLYNKRNRWDEMMQAAYDMAEMRVACKRGRNVKNADPYERDLVPHSSSPPPPESSHWA